MKVYEILEKINKTKFKREGICNLVLRELRNLTSLKESAKARTVWGRHRVRCFESWEKYSGNIDFPVPMDRKDPHSAYLFTTFKWNIFSKYGKNRQELLEHCIDWFKERDM